MLRSGITYFQISRCFLLILFVATSHMAGFALGSTPVTSLPCTSSFSCWKDLISFRPPPQVQASLADRGWFPHRIEGGVGPVNLDYFEVEIAQLPVIDGTRLTPEDFLYHIRQNLGSLLPPSVISRFAPLDAAVDGLNLAKLQKMANYDCEVAKSYERFSLLLCDSDIWG